MSSTALPKRTLGRTGLEVTTLGYGAMEVRGSRIWGGRPIEDREAETILNAVVDSGINFIDTANDYGRSEEYIGRYLSHRRDEYVLATKCGCTVVHRDDDDRRHPARLDPRQPLPRPAREPRPDEDRPRRRDPAAQPERRAGREGLTSSPRCRR